MALIVEDGTGLADAESLVSVAFADDHHLKRGNTAWAAATTAAKEAALVRATDFFERRWGGALTGQLLVATQALSLPREHGISRGLELASDEVWIGIKRAVAEYALKTLDGTKLWKDPERNLTGNVILERKKVDVIETETQYSDTRGVSKVPSYPEIDALVVPYLLGNGAGGSYR